MSGRKMRIAEFAAALGVSPDTIRRLEKRGVVKATRDGAGQRRYTDEDVASARNVLFRDSSTVEKEKR